MLVRVEIKHLKTKKGVRLRIAHPMETEADQIKHTNGMRCFPDKSLHLISHKDDNQIKDLLITMFDKGEVPASPSYIDEEYNVIYRRLDKAIRECKEKEFRDKIGDIKKAIEKDERC